MQKHHWLWRAARALIVGVWVLVLSSLFWPDPSTFRSLCWLTLGVMITAHGVEVGWFIWHHRRRNQPTPDTSHLFGVFAFGLFYFVPHLKATAQSEHVGTQLGHPG